MAIRSPIIVVLGHVDAGKTSLLDKIRKTAVAQREAGGITQHIMATEIPTKVIEEISRPLLNIFKFDLKIPGLLFIDTPGHEVFTNLRKRGGSIADLAVIVVDIIEGIQRQTIESIEICKEYKVPFVIALNKIDRISGWNSKENSSFLESIKHQNPKVIEMFEQKLYDVVVKLYELGFDSERFDRVKDFRKQVSIIPVSAKTGEGIPELLLILAGLSQRFLEEKLRLNVEGAGKGVILERREEKGLGTVIDVILYDGRIKKGDNILFFTKNGIKETKVKAIFKGYAITGSGKIKYKEVDEVYAAAGIRIVADNLEEALPGSNIFVFYSEKDKENIVSEMRKEMSEILFKSDKEGIIIKADTLGSLEALVRLIKEKGIPIAKADIGDIDKEDIDLCLTVRNKKKEYSVIIGFNVKIDPNVEDLIKSYNIKVILNNVIYRLIEDVEAYINEIKKKEEITLPPVAIIKILPGFVFRRSNPAIVGIEVVLGKIRKGMVLMREDGKVLGQILSIQKEMKNIEEASKGEKVAISIENAIVGRNIDEGDILYSYVSESDFLEYKKHKDKLSQDEKEILKKIAEIMRKNNPSWGL